MQEVWLLYECGFSWDGGDQVVGVYADRPSRLDIARAYLKHHSKQTCWKDGKPRRHKPLDSKEGCYRDIPFESYYATKVKVKH